METLQEQDHVLQLIQQSSLSSNDWLHFGALTTVAKSKTDWYWVNSGNRVDYNIKFADSQPDGGSELCLILQPKPHLKFHDVGCHGVSSEKFICQTRDEI